MTDSRQTDTKAWWRAWAKRVAVLVDWVEVGRSVRTVVAEYLDRMDDSTVLTYLPMAQEIDLTPLVTDMTRHHFLLTRTPAAGPLTIHAFDSPREQHRYGFDQPIEEAPDVGPDEVDVALIPGLAFDRRGVRLGRGKGYYDELIPRLGRATLIGIAPGALVVPELPAAAHDATVSILATELGMEPTGS